MKASSEDSGRTKTAERLAGIIQTKGAKDDSVPAVSIMRQLHICIRIRNSGGFPYAVYTAADHSADDTCSCQKYACQEQGMQGCGSVQSGSDIGDDNACENDQVKQILDG